MWLLPDNESGIFQLLVEGATFEWVFGTLHHFQACGCVAVVHSRLPCRVVNSCCSKQLSLPRLPYEAHLLVGQAAS
jgi:hypothetical protein